MVHPETLDRASSLLGYQYVKKVQVTADWKNIVHFQKQGSFSIYSLKTIQAVHLSPCLLHKQISELLTSLTACLTALISSLQKFL